jgi:hypothetical protein
VKRRGAACHQPLDCAVEIGLVARERLPDFDLAVEVDDLGDVVRLEPVNEARRGGLKGGQVIFHAGAAVEQQRQRDRLLTPGEVGDLLLDPVFEDRELGLLEVRDVMAGTVGRRHRQRDDVDAGAERALLLAGRPRGETHDDERGKNRPALHVSLPTPPVLATRAS